MPRKKAETPAEQPEKKTSTAAPKAKAAASSGPEVTVTGPPEEQAAPPSNPEAPAAEPSVEQATPASGAEAAAKVPEDTEEGQAAPEEKNGAGDEPRGCPAVVCSDRGLNLRVGPALSYEVTEVLPNGAEVTALDLPKGMEVPGWRLVDTGEKFGWVQSRFLRLER